MSDEITKGIIDKADGALAEVYKDAVHPIIKPLGEILSFLPRTLKLTLSGWEKWLINGEETLRLTAESVREKIKSIPEEKLVAPESYVAIPAMQQLSYCVNNEELRELYANLLVSSMNVDKKWNVHPAFVDIIKQLTPDEAKFIKLLFSSPLQNYPLIDIRLENEQGKGSILYSNFTDIGLNELDVPTNIGLYVDNLLRLKIIEVPPGNIFAESSAYDKLEQHPIVQRSLPKIHTKMIRIKFVHKVFNVTNMGVCFIKAVTP